jgi:phosphoribosylformimino-5-aminoimidazole carboxamide ribotide isomerase
MLVIPAIDLRGGRCVRLYQGDFNAETPYAITPAALLRRYERLKTPWVHVVDLDGAHDGVRLNAPVIENLARYFSLWLQVGGGVRSAAAVEALFDAGVGRVVIGSAAVERPHEVTAWLKCFGAHRLCLAFDVRIDGKRVPYVRTHGWTRTTAVSLWDALAAYPRGTIKYVLCTDIERDGTLGGPNLGLYREALTRFPDISWQASGGIRNAADLASLADVGVSAAVSGKAFLEEQFSPSELRRYLPDALSPASTSATAES